MIGHGVAPLVSLIGFITGTILYSMLLWMVVGSRSHSNRLALLTGIFGLSWNVGSFAAYALGSFAIAAPVPLLLAGAFSALCFLPAVVVHSAVRTSERWAMRWNVAVVATAYAMSAAATLMHFHSAVVFGTVPSHLALRGLTVGFAILLLFLLLIARGRDGLARGLWVIALAVFAVSALHLSGDHRNEDPWWLALLGHHASVPLALTILYQDYRFALADLFLKRALSLILLIGLVFGVYVLGAAPLLTEQTEGQGSRLLLLLMWAGTALAYPALKRGANWFVDKVILRRADYRQLLADASNAIENCETPETILDKVTQILKVALTSEAISWTEWISNDATPTTVRRRSLVLAVPTAEPPSFSLTVGPLSGGRRLLSDDQGMLDHLALIAGRRIDTVRASRERYDRDIREEEVRKLAAQAELRALRAQINPHFLFNALTTIGYLIQNSPPRALETLLRLSDLLRAVLRSSSEFVTVGEELDLVQAYLDIESARFEDRLRIEIDVPPELRSLQIPALVLQPLVENAIKHGVGRSLVGGDVRITAALDTGPSASASDQILVLSVTDTGAGAEPSDFEKGGRNGLGLANVERRIRLYGGESATLSINSLPGAGTTVQIHYPVNLEERDKVIRKTLAGSDRT